MATAAAVPTAAPTTFPGPAFNLTREPTTPPITPIAIPAAPSLLKANIL